jgi:hypothetical protein
LNWIQQAGLPDWQSLHATRARIDARTGQDGRQVSTKNRKIPRHIAPDFLQYLCERQNRLKKPNRKKHENNK